MNIRLITPADSPALRRLWETCPGVGLNDVDDTEKGIRKYLERNPTTCFAAEEKGELVGTVLAGHDGRRGYIYHLAVAESFRRKGIAKRLVDASLTALKAQGIQKAALVVFAENRLGNIFWEHMDFTERTDLVYRNKLLYE